MLGQRDAGQHDLEPSAGWLVHLAEDQAHLVQKPGLLQFVVQLVPFTNPLADAGEDARSLMSLDDIVDELQGQEALANAAPPRMPDLLPLTIGYKRSMILMPVSRI